MNIKVSIILPIFNGAKYMRQSIDSCLTQTHRNIELIIVDDCSTDETLEILKRYDDPRIRIIRHKKNMGLPVALNTGFSNATGEYLTWTSHDNYYLPGALEMMLKHLIKRKCDLVYCDFYWFDDSGKEPRRVSMPDVPTLDEGNAVGACFLYTKEVRDTIGEYNTEIMLVEDYDYWIRVSKRFKMCHLNETLYYFRQHVSSLTAIHVRQHEIEIFSIILRYSHGLIDKTKVTEQVVKFVVSKDSKIKSKAFRALAKIVQILSLNKITRVKFKERLLKMRIEGDIHRTIVEYDAKKSSMTEVKNRLVEIVARCKI